MNIGVVGLGYVGLCTAACFATAGFDVTGVDNDVKRVELLEHSDTPFQERGLKTYLKRAVEGGSLHFSTDYASLGDRDVIFIAVGTPSLSDGSIDLSYVKESAKELGKLLRSTGYKLIVVKSTVIPGTTRKVVMPMIERYSGKSAGVKFGLCSNPEFLREGSAIKDTLHPDKLVIGAEDERSYELLARLYNDFYGSSMPPVVRTDITTAELIKYANNAYLAMKVSYINTIARLCEEIPGGDVGCVAEAIGLDSRIGPKFLEAGPGYGGSCFPKDVSALVHFSKRLRVSAPILDAIVRTNDEQASHVLQLAEKTSGVIAGKLVGVLGLSFKEGTDDVRDSPSIKVVTALLKKGANVRVYDPAAMKNATAVLGPRVTYAGSVSECLEGTDLCIIMTGWDEFKRLKESDFLNMNHPVVVDARRICNPDDFKRIRLTVLGRGVREDPSQKV